MLFRPRNCARTCRRMSSYTHPYYTTRQARDIIHLSAFQMRAKKRQRRIEKLGCDLLPRPAIAVPGLGQADEGDPNSRVLQGRRQKRTLLDRHHPIPLAVDDEERWVARIDVGQRRGPGRPAQHRWVGQGTAEKQAPRQRPVKVGRFLPTVGFGQAPDTRRAGIVLKDDNRGRPSDVDGTIPIADRLHRGGDAKIPPPSSPTTPEETPNSAAR
jgi:hypothetical protein